MLCMVYFKNQNSIGFVLPPFALDFLGGAGCLTQQAARLTHAGTVSSRIWNTKSAHLSPLPLEVPTKMVIDELKTTPKTAWRNSGRGRAREINLKA